VKEVVCLCLVRYRNMASAKILRSKQRLYLIVFGFGFLLAHLLAAVRLERKETIFHSDEVERVLVSYAYAEGLGNGGKIDRYNLHFFIRVALAGNAPGTMDFAKKVDYVFVVNGWNCEPCESSLKQVLSTEESKKRGKEWITVLYRNNTGMDIGAHNASISWAKKRRPGKYQYFIFLNSSSRGPFMPKWTPSNFHFTDVLTQFMRENRRIKIAGSYISCLSGKVEQDDRIVMETLFFCLDSESLNWAVADGIFNIYDEKYLTALLGEYALLNSIFKRGGMAEGLSMRYSKNLDWADGSHSSCNDNRHSYRRGNLEGGLSPNLLENIFVKASWCVRAAESAILSRWLLKLSDGYAGTEGISDETGWEYGSSPRGTSSKNGTLKPDIPVDGCQFGNIDDLRVESFGF